MWCRNPTKQEALPEPLAPILELDAFAVGPGISGRSRYFPEYRGRGFGTALLAEAENMARRAGARQFSLAVESANVGAVRFYRRHGFRDHARRPFVPFPGSTDEGDWLPMIKDIA